MFADPTETASIGPSSEQRASIEGGLACGSLGQALSEEGDGGTYFLSEGTRRVAVFKPSVEEIGMERNPKNNTDPPRVGFEPGECYHREVLAYLLDHRHFAGVPETWEAVVGGHVGSVQRYAEDCIASWSTLPGRFSVGAVHRIALFDLRTLNCDRHGGNVLVRGDDLIPIDHGYILPDTFSDPEFEWKEWPQSAVPFSADERAYVAQLDPVADARLVEGCLGPSAAEVHYFASVTVQQGVRNGYTARQLAEFFRRPKLTEPSGFECLLATLHSSEAYLDEHLPPR